MITPLTITATAGLVDARITNENPATKGADEATAFASLLAALVLPGAVPESVEPVEEHALSDLEAAPDEHTADAAGNEATTSGEQNVAHAAVEARVGDTRSADAEALVAASRAMAATVSASMEPVRTPGALNPEFREKLSRVVSRMRELGHDVRVVETIRSQERQDKLFAQGRTESGPVVTWTRRSRHIEGLAADVTVDGKFGGKAFNVLHRIASEEGLRTLGARDPGHIELPRTKSDAASPAPSTAAAPTPRMSLSSVSPLSSVASLSPVAPLSPVTQMSPTAQLSPVASVASVAKIATVAHVATVAQVAPAASSSVAPSSVARSGRTADETPMLATRATRTNATRMQSSQASAALGTMRDLAKIAIRRRSEQGDASETPNDGSMSRQDALAIQLGSGRSPSFGAQLAEAAGLVPTDTSMRFDRVDRVLAAQDAARGRPLHELTMSLDGLDGGTDRIRVGVTGRSVAATIEMHDSSSAAQMTTRLEDLSRALERAGLEPEALRVASSDSRDTMREAAATTVRASLNVAEASRNSSANPGRQEDTTPRDRDAWTHDDRPRHGGRHRSRQEQQENTK